MKKKHLLIIFVAFVSISLSAQIPTDNLVAYWPFNGNAVDESGNGNDGTVYGAILTSDRFGIPNSAYDFDGIDDYIQLPPNTYFSGDFSVSGWIYLESLTNYCSFFDFSQGNCNNVRVNLYAYGGSFTHGQIKEGNSGSNLYCNENIPFNVWTHFVLVLEGYSSSFYFNGNFINSDPTNHIPLTVTRSINYFARCTEPGSVFTDMRIDDFRIYSDVLTENEILALYNEVTSASIITNPISQTVCKGENVSFEVEASGAPPIMYQWQKDEINIPNATGNIFSISNTQESDAGGYRCIVSNTYGSDTSDVAILSVVVVPPATIYGPPNVDEWEVAIYSVTYQQNHTYEFIVENGNIISSTDNSVEVQWGSNGYGYVHMIETNEIGCVGDTITLEVTIGTVGVKDFEQNKLIVYPNPVRDYITLEKEGENIILFYGLDGRLLMKKEFKDKITIDLIIFSKGIYLYRIGEHLGKIVVN